MITIDTLNGICQKLYMLHSFPKQSFSFACHAKELLYYIP